MLYLTVQPSTIRRITQPPIELGILMEYLLHMERVPGGFNPRLTAGASGPR